MMRVHFVFCFMVFDFIITRSSDYLSFAALGVAGISKLLQDVGFLLWRDRFNKKTNFFSKIRLFYSECPETPVNASFFLKKRAIGFCEELCIYAGPKRRQQLSMFCVRCLFIPIGNHTAQILCFVLCNGKFTLKAHLCFFIGCHKRVFQSYF